MKLIALAVTLIVASASAQQPNSSPPLWAQMQEAILGRSPNLEKVKQVVAAGFDINSPIGCGTYSALDGAVDNYNVEMVKFLLAHGAKPKGRELQSAARCPNTDAAVEIVKALLTAGADPNYRELYDRDPNRFTTALHVSCSAGNDRIVELLLAQPHIELNTFDIDGRTPLMWAVERGHDRIVSLLMAKGADPNVVSPGGLTAAKLAEEQVAQRQQILHLLHDGRSAKAD